MSYLVIMFLLATAAIARLWVQQRRERSHRETVDGFQMALAKISQPNPVQRGPRRAVSATRPSVARARTGREPQPLDPVRREAAKRRLEARRRARAGSAI